MEPLPDREAAETVVVGGGGGGQGGLPGDLGGGLAGSGGGDVGVGALEVDWKLVSAETSSDMSSLPLPVRLSFSSDNFSTIARKPAMLVMLAMSVLAKFVVEVLGLSVFLSVFLSVVLRVCFSDV